MKKNQAKKNKSTNALKIISEEEIKEKNIPKNELWYLLINKKPVGPYHTLDLQDFIQDNLHFALETYISNYVNTKWIPMYKCEPFQTIISQMDQKDYAAHDPIFILNNGQKEGPFQLAEIKEKLQKKEILYTDFMTSKRSGDQWTKICEHPYFNRRKKARNRSLPDSLSLPSFKNTEQDVMEELNFKLKNQNEEEGLIGLAFMGTRKNLNSGPGIPPSDMHGDESGISLARILTNKYFLLPLIALLLLFSASFFIDRGPEIPTAPANLEKEKDKNKKQKSTNRSPKRSNKTETRRSQVVDRKNEREKARERERERQRKRELQRQKAQERERKLQQQRERERREREQEEIDKMREQEYRQAIEEQNQEQDQDEISEDFTENGQGEKRSKETDHDQLNPDEDVEFSDREDTLNLNDEINSADVNPDENLIEQGLNPDEDILDNPIQ